MGSHRNALVAAHIVVILALVILKRRRRRWYQHDICANRVGQGEFYNMLQELRHSPDEGEKFNQVMRMSIEQFDWLLGRISHRLQHKTTHAIPISPAERLAITIR